MVLDRLLIFDFRIFAKLELGLHPGMNFLIGCNGQGKTTILEAVCVLLRLQSPRTYSLLRCVRLGAESFLLRGLYGGEVMQVCFREGRKEFLLDGKVPGSTGEYLAVGKVVWMSASDNELVKGPAAARRRFLDFLGAQCVTGYLKQLRAYEKALRSRNALLKAGAGWREVRAFDGPLCEAGNFLTSARFKLVVALVPIARKFCGMIGMGDGDLELVYVASVSGEMEEALEAKWALEQRVRTTVVGPHRDELEIKLGGWSASEFCSEGQQRTLALALKLAQGEILGYELGRPPIYLIDDVFGELDEERRNNLMKILPVEAQKLITSTSLSWLSGVMFEGQIFEVSQGEVREV